MPHPRLTPPRPNRFSCGFSSRTALSTALLGLLLPPLLVGACSPSRAEPATQRPEATVALAAPVGAGSCLPPPLAFPSSFSLVGTVRDFRDTHPDFERTIVGYDKGIVQGQLGPDQKPVYASNATTLTTTGKTTFDQWYRDTAQVNQALPLTLELTRDSNGLYTYSNGAFFPIDEKGFGNEWRGHNFHFTYEAHSLFRYNGGETFRFTGDDDLWVFINDKLAIDLGGVHGAETAEVNLDQQAVALGIETGKSYKLDLFFAERHTDQSSFRIDTTLALSACTCVPSAEVCDGKDNNCNGVVDESAIDAGAPCTPTGVEPIVGECKPGTSVCTAGALTCQNYQGPKPEVCDGKDNNCNGKTDEDVTVLSDGNPCTVDACDPVTGLVTYNSAPVGTSCDDGNTCNGVDICQTTCPAGVIRPIDIVMVIDSSSSMNQELDAVTNNINTGLALALNERKVDYRLILLTPHGVGNAFQNAICVTSPLSDTTCQPVPDQPANNDRFRQYSIEVASENSLSCCSRPTPAKPQPPLAHGLTRTSSAWPPTAGRTG